MFRRYSNTFVFKLFFTPVPTPVKSDPLISYNSYIYNQLVSLHNFVFSICFLLCKLHEVKGSIFLLYSIPSMGPEI